jgi:hypothetical protein
MGYNPADCRLIAAAPDLLAALERAWRWMEVEEGGESEAAEASAQARAAIARVRGE